MSLAPLKRQRRTKTAIDTIETAIFDDGHNRYEICHRLGIYFSVRPLDFESRDDAADWIDTQQLGRRNLSPEAASLLRGRRYNRAKKAHGAAGGELMVAIRYVDQMVPV